MKKWYGSALLFALLLLVGLSTFGQRKNQPKVTWEYKVTGAPGSAELKLNQLGAQGWELVSVDQAGTVFYLETKHWNYGVLTGRSGPVLRHD